MVRFAFPLIALVGVLTSAFGQPATWPKEVHPSAVRAIEKSDAALRAGDHQLAMAMLVGSLYPDGITVGIDETNLKTAGEKVRRATDRAVETWSRYLGGDSPIRLVRRADAAAVRIQLVSSLDIEQENALGFINLEKRYRWNKSFHEVQFQGTIKVLSHWDGLPLTEDEFTEVICHELGHLLGLADMPNPGPLMGPAVKGRTVTEPAMHEVKILRDLRATLWQRYQAAKNLFERSAKGA